MFAMSSVEKRVVVLKFGGPKFQATMKGMHEAYTNEKSSRIGPQYQASCCGGLAPHTGSGGGSERQEQLCAGNADKSSKRAGKCWQTYKLPQAEWTSTITQPMHQKLARFSPRL